MMKNKEKKNSKKINENINRVVYLNEKQIPTAKKSQAHGC